MTTERQTRKDRLNAFDQFVTHLLATDREKAAEDREMAAIEERLRRQAERDKETKGSK